MKTGWLLAGELASRAGISRDTLTHYEKIGVLPPPDRSGNGYRRYPPEAIERIASIQRALDLGFTLQELVRFFEARSEGNPPCMQVRALAEQKLNAVRERLSELRLLEREIERTLASWDERLEQHAAYSEPARLIETLADDRTSASPRRIGRKPIRRKS